MQSPESKRLVGILSISPDQPEDLNYPLINFFSNTLEIEKFNFSPPLPEDSLLLVQDIRVGGASQFAGGDSFKASILDRLSASLFEHVPAGSPITVVFKTPPKGEKYEGEFSIAMAPATTSKAPFTLLPVESRSQLSGCLVELAITQSLFKAFESGDVGIKVISRLNVPKHQQVPEHAYEPFIEEGRLIFKDTVEIEAGGSFDLIFSGPRENDFDKSDAVGVVRVEK